MRLAFAWLGVVLLAGAGLVAGLPPPLVRPLAVLADAQALPEDAGAVPVALPWNGTVACPGACVLQVPAGASGELWAAWDGTRTAGFTAALDGAAGVPGFDAVRLGQVSGGERVALWGNGAADLVVLPPTPGVPELAALVPANVGQALGQERGHGPPAGIGASCLAEEARDLGARSCLRFTTGVANVGGAALSLSSQARDGEARMTQALPAGDRPVGIASYHAAHGHFHYARFVAFDLYERDDATGLRGEQVLASSKTGFCMVDFGHVGGMEPAPKTFWRDGCAPSKRTLRMGVNAGWYDIYRWFLPEQYVEATGLPDGTYELVATVDPDGTLVEGHTLDNRASTVFRWQGGEATTLAEHGLYRLTPQPS